MSRRSEEARSSLEPQPDIVDVLDTTAAGGLVIRGSVIRTAGYVAGVGLSVVAASLMVRHLGVVDWGRYVTVMSLIGIVAGLSEAGMTAIGVREYSTRERAERDTLIRNLLGLRLGLTVVGVAAAVTFAVAAGYRPVLVGGTAIAGVGALFAVAQQTYGIPLAAGLRLGWQTGLDLVRQVATVALVIALVVANASLSPFFVVPIPVWILVLVLTLVLVRRSVPLLPAFDRQQWRDVVRLTIVFSAASAVATFYVPMTVVLTSLVGSSRDTGYYGASFRIFVVLTAIPLLLANSAFPVVARAARDDETRLQYSIQRLFETAVVFGAWMVLATALGARFAIDVVAGSKFGPSVPVLQIQAFGLLATFVSVTWSTALLALHRHRALLLVNVVALSVSVAATLSLVPVLGAKGAAIATVAGEVALAAAYSLAVTRGPQRIAVSLGVLPRVALAVAPAAALVFVHGLHGVALVAAASAVYFGLAFVFRAVPPELLDAMRKGRRGEQPG
jgi:O-antigen/teichoic acid export membrane protein